MKIFVYHTSIRTYNTRLSTRTANRTHARKRAVSGLVIQITINTPAFIQPVPELHPHWHVPTVKETLR
jgi:hypothetical protein